MADIYLAARYSRFPEMLRAAKQLTVHGHAVTSHWILGKHESPAYSQALGRPFMPLGAQEDPEALVATEIVIAFTEPPEEPPSWGRGGGYIECAMALALGKRCIVVGYRENVLHWLEKIEFYETWQACLATLIAEKISGGSKTDFGIVF